MDLLHKKGKATTAELALDATEAEIAARDALAVAKLEETLERCPTPKKPRRHVGGETTRMLVKTPSGFAMEKKNGSRKHDTAFSDVEAVAPPDPAKPRTVASPARCSKRAFGGRNSNSNQKVYTALPTEGCSTAPH